MNRDVPRLDPASLTRLVGAYRLSQAIVAAARLGIADELTSGPLDAEDLAGRIGAHGPSLYRLLRALAGEGVLDEPQPGQFGLNEFSTRLRSDRPDSLHDFVIGWSGLSVTYHAFADLAAAVRTGENAVQRRYGARFHEYLTTDPTAADEYASAMEASGASDPDAIAAAYEWTGIRSVVDVGGGQGSFLAAILRRCPDAEGILFDLPGVVAGASERLAGRPEAQRLRIVGGDMFDSLPPGADAYVFSTVLRCFSDQECLPVLQRCRAAMHGSSRLLAIEMVYPSGHAVPVRGLADLQAMILYGGRDRTTEEWRALFAEAGLRLGRIVALDGPHSYIEAFPD